MAFDASRSALLLASKSSALRAPERRSHAAVADVRTSRTFCSAASVNNASVDSVDDADDAV
eukprot:354545-Chlamydomonas_euryale.AAC.11